jgi:hypothetical protein
MRRLALAPASACLLAAPALAFMGPVTKRGDLDGDRARESVTVKRVDIPGVDDAFDRTEVRVKDSCPSGSVNRRVAGPEDNLELLRLKRADTHTGREVYVKLRSGAAARLGQARLVAWRRASGRACRKPRPLFSYSSDRHTATPPGGTGDISAFDTKLRNASRRFRGLEVVLVETFNTASDPPCCGSLKKRTYWRYSRGGDRYVRYGTKLQR